MTFAADIPAVDHYLATRFDRVRGMSSRFATTILSYLMGRQTRVGITGHFAEVGTFEGRLFVAGVLALQPGERALGIDVFNWPDDKVEERLRGHLADAGIAPETTIIHKGLSFDLTPADVLEKLGGPARMWHVDGEHTREALTRDMDLAHATLHPNGIMVLDDMLHLEYPLLVVAVHEWLQRHPDMRVLAVLDRESIVAAAKFVLCKADAVPLYEADLMERFKAQHYILGSEWERYFCVVLSPDPKMLTLD